MKSLKIKLLFIFSFLSLVTLADEFLPWTASYLSLRYRGELLLIQNKFPSKEAALEAATQYIPFQVSITTNNLINLKSVVDALNDYDNYGIRVTTTLFNYDSNGYKFCITNTVTGEYLDLLSYIPDCSKVDFVKSTLRHFINNDIKQNLFSENVIVHYSFGTSYYPLQVIIDYPSFCNNLIKCVQNSDISFIKENIELLLPFLISNYNNISNSFDRVLLNSDSALSSIQNIDSMVSTFPNQLDDIITNTSYLKLKSYASGSLSDFSFGNPDSQAEGPLYFLYQLTRDERGEPENLVVTQREAYNYLGLDKEYGSWPSPNDYKRINQILAVQVVSKTDAQAKKYQDLYSIADDDGYVIDPETGEKVSLQDAFKNWNNQKAQGAIASYSYNNPFATNGFFGALKRHLTDASDWRLLDKNFKNKIEQFTDDVQEDGIKIKNGTSPLRVSVQQDVPISVDISKESFDGVVISTDSKEDIQLFRGAFNSFFELWQVYSGVSDKSSRSWLDLINENNSNYYDFVRDKLYLTLSNDLASIVRNTSRTNDFYNSLSNQLERIITSHDVTVASTSPFEIYANQNVSTLNHPIPDAYLLYDEPYSSYEGTTNFDQAVIFMLHDQHVIAQNNLKANIMSADYIRGIYHSLYSGSNIAQRVDYITNQVFSANSLSIDSDHDYSSAYASQADELKTHLDEIVTSITEFKSQTLEKLTPIANQIFADYILPSKLTVLNFRDNKFQVDLIKYRTIFDLMHYASSVAWLIIGLLMLPRVIYMLLAFSLKILGKFYNIMR